MEEEYRNLHFLVLKLEWIVSQAKAAEDSLRMNEVVPPG